jgi:hypothetical protein
MKNIIKVFLGTLSLADALAIESTQKIAYLQDEFEFIQTSDESGLYMKKPTEDSFVQYNQFKRDKIKDSFKTVQTPEEVDLDKEDDTKELN